MKTKPKGWRGHGYHFGAALAASHTTGDPAFLLWFLFVVSCAVLIIFAGCKIDGYLKK